ncbi:POK18 protein, partial [Eurystomus gularis]|nr:POK18 protein [Eurystomus gularis]
NIKPQPLQTNWKISTLHDLQKLLGTINWIRPMLGIANHELQNLFVTLKGDNDLNSK